MYSQDVNDSSVKELLIESESFLKRINALFDDLEYSVSVLENVSNLFWSDISVYLFVLNFWLPEPILKSVSVLDSFGLS